jgi:hypothetical protein
LTQPDFGKRNKSAAHLPNRNTESGRDQLKEKLKRRTQYNPMAAAQTKFKRHNNFGEHPHQAEETNLEDK